MKGNNKGFTLIELVVVIAIMSIVMTSVFSFMTTSSYFYSSVNHSANLQYESQVAMSQIQEYVLSCGEEMTWDTTKKELIVKNSAADYKTFYNQDNTLYIKVDTQSQIVAKHIQNLGFTVEFPERIDIEDASGTDIPHALSISVTLSFEHAGREYTATQEWSLRNRPIINII